MDRVRVRVWVAGIGWALLLSVVTFVWWFGAFCLVGSLWEVFHGS
jgi:hypothetical protein